MLIQTSDLSPQSPISPSAWHQTYCGLDCCITLEVLEELQRTHNSLPAIYDFERALQAPYFEIMQRGFRVDRLARQRASESLFIRIDALQQRLNRLAVSIWGRPLNARSHKQMKDFFYGALHMPEIWTSKKGERKLSLDREALEKLERYLYARPFVSLVLSIRDLAKQKEVFDTEIDPDGRFRASYNIAGTETGRPSSSENAFGTGGNAQNIDPDLRYVFVADPAYKLVVIDLEQVEARDVGYFLGCLFEDWSFLDACESGDLHTANAQRIWPHLRWTGDLKRDRKIAEDTEFYRGFSYRDMAKRGSHLSNYKGSAWTGARHLKIPIEMMEEFHQRYITGPQAAFPGIARYWQWVAQELQQIGWLATPFGRRRHFFGRPGDDTTIREAIAFLPQSTTADRMNLGLWRIWRQLPQAQLLAQTYDSVTFQLPEGPGFDEGVAKALELIRVELVAPNGRSYVVPGEAKVGWNWGNVEYGKDGKVRGNPEGLAKWTPGGDQRQRLVGLQRLAG